MKYENVCSARFIARPNRFIAEVLLEGCITRCHVKNTGRCKELLKENATIYLQQSSDSRRKTACSLISVEKGERLVNIDSQAPNKVFHEALINRTIQLPGFEDLTLIKPEKKYGGSRFDFYVESGLNRAFIEVKGATLEEEGVAKFPDAPTERGVKHLLELIKARKEGYSAFIVFIIQMKEIWHFSPNDRTHQEFGDALRLAYKHGVKLLAYECDVMPDEIRVNGKSCQVIL